MDDEEIVGVPRRALADLVARMDALEAEVAELRRPAAPGRPTSAAPSGTAAGADTPARLGRRRALAGLAGAAAAGTVAVVASGAPAAAANGSNLVLGTDANAASSLTGLGIQGSSALFGFVVADNGVTQEVGTRAAVMGHAKNNNFLTAVHGQAEGAASHAVWGNALASATAVRGDSATGAGGVFSTGSGGLKGAVEVAATNTGGLGVYVYAAETHLEMPANVRPAPPSDSVAGRAGQLRWTGDGALWGCVADGTPGTWRRLAGPGTAGQLSVLPAPARVYDSRPGTAPTTVGPKTRFGANQTRTFDLKANGSGVPAKATAALVTLLLVNASATAGNLTIWANGVAKPLANTMVWGGSAGRFSATAVTAVDGQSRVQVNASQPTDLVIDVVGYYR